MRYRTRITASIITAVCVAGLAAACSGKASSTGATPGGGSQGMTAYLSCLSKNGVTMQLPSGAGQRSPGAFPSGVRPSGVRPSGGASGGPGGQGRPGGFGGLQQPSGVDDATWQKAQQACASLLPSGGPQGGGQNNSAITAYRNCLSQHGVTASTGAGQLNTADPAVAAAVKACAALEPSGQPAPSAS